MCQSTDLPLEMISALLAFGRAVTEHVSAQRDGSLDDHECGVLEHFDRLVGAVNQMPTLRQIRTPSPGPASRILQRLRRFFAKSRHCVTGLPDASCGAQSARSSSPIHTSAQAPWRNRCRRYTPTVR
jgi:hypothetical protein